MQVKEYKAKMETLSYKDEADRAYGLGAMAVCMVVWDNEQYMSGLSLDASENLGLEISRDYFLQANQNLSAKGVWNSLFSRMQMDAGLLVSNAMGRIIVRGKREITPQEAARLLDLINEEGEAMCSLEKDESRALFDKCFNYFHRIFSHPTVGELVGRIASDLQRNRRLDRDELMVILRPLLR